MISGVNGIYPDYRYALRPEASKINGQRHAGSAGYLVNRVSEPGKDEYKLNQLSLTLQVNTVSKTQEVVTEKVTTCQTGSTQPHDTSKFISIIESSRQISQQISKETVFQPILQLPESQGQLIVSDANSSDIKTEELYTNLVYHFNQADTNRDHLLSYNEVFNFINRF